MNVHYQVELTDEEREGLIALTRSGSASARRIRRAQVLLMSDRRHTAAEIEEALSLSASTVYRIREHFVEESLERALSEAPRKGSPRFLTEN